MRVRLFPGKQKEMLYKNKGRYGTTWREMAGILGVERYQVVGWVFERSLIPEDKFFEIDKNGEYLKYVIELLPENWGKLKAGAILSARFNKPKLCKSFEHSEDSAELTGILLGDGNITAYINGRAQVYQVSVASGRKNEEEYARNFVAPLLTKLSGIDYTLFLRNNAVYSRINSKEFVKELGRHGLHPGNKIKNKLRIPGWIFEKDEYLRACIRGLVDTDGSICHLSNKDPHLGRITFKSFNSYLLKDAREALVQLGFHPSKATYNQIYLTRKSDLLKYYKEIGSNNSYKRMRLEKFIAP
jgi:hypothetical protein